MADKTASNSTSMGLTAEKTLSISGATTNHNLTSVMEPYDSFTMTPGWSTKTTGSHSLPNSNSTSRSVSPHGAEPDVTLGQSQQMVRSAKTKRVSKTDLKSVLLTENLIFDD
eukprot:CAMPEP_0178430880 /NCGR_PEP_ID=MMETSP0689_2-20121128/31549_1 /TAXON_ID=160604 /ORGANISM="Amphidinium massartii, Strain CS-259" /LENGTH=111 /DNA_ID=CAMNT_0020052753 /DNA_START=91 /DNA_END=426 /DNA_ORIENTATION=+